MATVLETHELTKTYHGREVVSKASITIEEGDIYGFVGENGAGKTTIIRMVTGLVNPTSGSYTLFGQPIKGKRSPKQVAAVVETPSLYLNFSAYENMKIQAATLGYHKNDEEIVEILSLVGLSSSPKDRIKVKSYSLGMKQRLGIGIALLGSPSFLLLDEPMNGLDPQGIVEIRELILRLNREQGITFLISSHILGELERVATKFGFISHGKMLKEMTTDELHLTCRHSIDLECDDIVTLAKTLTKKLDLHDLTAPSKQVLRIYDSLSLSALFQVILDEKIELKSIRCVEETVEDYYLNLMRGAQNG